VDTNIVFPVPLIEYCLPGKLGCPDPHLLWLVAPIIVPLATASPAVNARGSPTASTSTHPVLEGIELGSKDTVGELVGAAVGFAVPVGGRLVSRPCVGNTDVKGEWLKVGAIVGMTVTVGGGLVVFGDTDGLSVRGTPVRLSLGVLERATSLDTVGRSVGVLVDVGLEEVVGTKDGLCVVGSNVVVGPTDG
jgi:hypothetical protein